MFSNCPKEENMSISDVCEIVDFKTKEEANDLIKNGWELLGVHNLKSDIGDVPHYVLGKLKK